MTDQQQKDFVEEIQGRMDELVEEQKLYPFQGQKYWFYDTRIIELKWVLEKFNQVKTK